METLFQELAYARRRVGAPAAIANAVVDALAHLWTDDQHLRGAAETLGVAHLAAAQ